MTIVEEECFLYIDVRKFESMKKRDKGFIIAGSLGFLVVFGVIVLRKFLNEQTFEADYEDYHRNFSQDDLDDDHGIEFLAMQ